MKPPSEKPDLAVALSYAPETDSAPKVVAKGRGYLAEQIVTVAREHGVVIDTSPELAEALSGVDLDETIPIELYRAVAEIIAYVLKTGEKLK